MSKPGSENLLGYGYALLGAVLFATKGVFIKFAYAQGLDTATVITLRMVFSLPVFAGIAIASWLQQQPGQRPSPKMLMGGAIVGMLGYYVSSWLDFAGLAHISAQLERLILFTYPFFTIIFTALLFRKPPSRSAMIGAAVSYSGLVLIMSQSGGGGHGDMATGGGLILCAAVTFGLYQVLAREFIVRMGSNFYTGLAMSAAAVAVFTHFAASGHDLHSFAVSPRALGITLGLAVFATIMPAFAMAAGMARIGAQGTAIIGTLSPLVNTILAVSVLGEPFGWTDAVGTLLVIGGVGVYTLIDSRGEARVRTHNL